MGSTAVFPAGLVPIRLSYETPEGSELWAEAEPGAVSAGPGSFDTDVMTAVVAGGGRLGANELVTGDMVIRPRGVAHEAVVAGPEGLQEVTVFGDRRALERFAADHNDVDVATTGWPATLAHTLLPDLEHTPAHP